MGIFSISENLANLSENVLARLIIFLLYVQFHPVILGMIRRDTCSLLPDTERPVLCHMPLATLSHRRTLPHLCTFPSFSVR